MGGVFSILVLEVFVLLYDFSSVGLRFFECAMCSSLC